MQSPLKVTVDRLNSIVESVGKANTKRTEVLLVYDYISLIQDQPILKKIVGEYILKEYLRIEKNTDKAYKKTVSAYFDIWEDLARGFEGKRLKEFEKKMEEMKSCVESNVSMSEDAKVDYLDKATRQVLGDIQFQFPKDIYAYYWADREFSDGYSVEIWGDYLDLESIYEGVVQTRVQPKSIDESTICSYQDWYNIHIRDWIKELLDNKPSDNNPFVHSDIQMKIKRVNDTILHHFSKKATCSTKYSIVIDWDEGISLKDEPTVAWRNVRENRMKLLQELKNGKRTGEALAKSFYSGNFSTLSKAINGKRSTKGINYHIREKIGVPFDLIVKVGSGGYKLNDKNFKITWADE